MNFIKTQKLLSQQASQTEIPLESVLELMRCYLTELRYHTNTPVDRCRIGNMSQMVASLAAISNDILFVYRTNEKAIHAEENRFTQALTKAQNACADYHSRIKTLDEQLQQEEANRQQLEALQKQEASRSAALVQLRQQTANLQGQIDALRATDPETEAGKLNTQITEKNQELARLTAEYSRMQQEHDEKQKQLEADKAQLAALRSLVDADCAQANELSQIIKDQQDTRKELMQQIQNLEHEARQLREDNDSARLMSLNLIEENKRAEAVLEQQNIENSTQQTSIEEKLAQQKSLEAKLEQSKSFEQALDQQYTDLKGQNTALEEQIAALEQDILKIKEAGGQLLDQLNDMLDQKRQCEEDFSDACQLHTDCSRDLQMLEEKILQQSHENTVILEAVDSKNTLFTQLNAAHQEKAQLLAQLTADIEQLQGALQLTQEETSRSQAEIAAAEEALAIQKAKAAQLLHTLAEADLLCKTKQEELEELEEALSEQTRSNAVIQDTIDSKNANLTQLQEIHREKSTQLDVLNGNIGELEGQLQQLQEDASRRRTEIAATVEALKAEQEEFDQLLEQHITLNVDLEAQKTANAIFKTDHLEPVQAQMAELVMQARKDQEQQEELKNSLKLVEEKHAELLKKNVMLIANLKTWQNKLAVVQAEYEKNQQAVAVLNADLEIKSAESTKLLEREKELRELLDEKNVARITAELDSCNKKLEEDIRRAEQTEQTLNTKQRELNSLQQRHSAILDELEICRTRHNDLLSRHELATLELDRITCPENRRRCENLHNQLLVMQTLQEQLMDKIRLTCGENFTISEQLQEHLDQAEQAIQTLRSVIREYAALRQNALESSN